MFDRCSSAQIISILQNQLRSLFQRVSFLLNIKIGKVSRDLDQYTMEKKNNGMYKKRWFFGRNFAT